MQTRKWRRYVPKWNDCRALDKADQPSFEIREATPAQLGKIIELAQGESAAEAGLAIMNALADPNSDVRKVFRKVFRNPVNFESDDGVIVTIDDLIDDASTDLLTEMMTALQGGVSDAGNSESSQDVSSETTLSPRATIAEPVEGQTIKS